MTPRAARLLVLGCLLFVSARASAHPTPGSTALIDFTVDGARIEQDVPVEELERSTHATLARRGESAAELVRRNEGMLRSYALAHLQARGSTNPWAVELVDLAGHDAADGPRVRFRFALQAPAGEASSTLHLHDDIVAHEVVSHYIAIYVRSDWASGAVQTAPRLAGTVHAGNHDVTLARDGSFARGLRSTISLGIEHITSGTDHLLFLFALVLIAPVAASGGRWQRRRDLPDTLLTLAKVVTAFTIGHSLTLALGALCGVSLSSTFVEAAIAASILVTAVHALRPIFARREAVIACGFGLIHGLAFASSLMQRDLGRAQAAWTLFGFNLGIELAQLALLFLVTPWLITLARTRAYDVFRRICAIAIGTLASAWLWERTTGFTNPTAPIVAWLDTHAFALLLLLAATAVIARIREAPHPLSGQTG